MDRNKIIVRSTLARSGIGIFGGIGTAVLAILALAGVETMLLGSIAAIVAGVTMFFEGGAVVAEMNRLLVLQDTEAERRQLVGGLSAEMVAGAAGAVLGVLALFGIIRGELIAIAVILFGAGLVMGTAVINRLNELRMRGVSEESFAYGHDATRLASGVQALVGLGTIVLGILAVLHISQTFLSLIGLLVIGIGTLLAESAVGGRIMTLFK